MQVCPQSLTPRDYPFVIVIYSQLSASQNQLKHRTSTSRADNHGLCGCMTKNRMVVLYDNSTFKWLILTCVCFKWIIIRHVMKTLLTRHRKLRALSFVLCHELEFHRSRGSLPQQLHNNSKFVFQRQWMQWSSTCCIDWHSKLLHASSQQVTTLACGLWTGSWLYGHDSSKQQARTTSSQTSVAKLCTTG